MTDSARKILRIVVFLFLIGLSGTSAFLSSLSWQKKRFDLSAQFYHIFQVEDVTLKVNGLARGEEHRSIHRYLQQQTSFLNGRLIWRVDGRAIYEQLLAHPSISKAAVTRRWPRKVEISVTVPHMLAIWKEREAGQDHMMSLEGKQMGMLDVFMADQNLPVITGDKEASYELVALLMKYPALWDGLIQAVHVEERRWDLFLGDVVVRLPQKGVEESLKRLSFLYKPSFSLLLEEIDLRIFGRVGFVLRPELRHHFGETL